MNRNRLYYLGLSLWSLVYIVGVLIAPLAPNRFNLTAARTHFLQITIALPIVLIWLIAVYGIAHFKAYTDSIHQDKDGRAMNRLANGLTVLVISVMVNGLTSIVRPWAIQDHWIRGFTIFFEYLQVILPLIAFIIIYRGSTALLALARNGQRGSSISRWLPTLLIIAVVAILYAITLSHYGYRSQTPDAHKYSSFYLPDALIISTLGLPNILGWTLAIKSAFNIADYKRNVSGIIYRSALARLVYGVVLVTGFAIVLQLINALSVFIAKAKLGSILLIVYLIILFYALGFLVIASAAKKLNAIEGVEDAS